VRRIEIRVDPTAFRLMRIEQIDPQQQPTDLTGVELA